MATSNPTKSTAARYFGQTSPKELAELERNASNATGRQLAKAAYYLQHAFAGQYYAWFGAWALRLRGSRRDTSDIDLSVLLEDIGQVRAVLAMHDWAILPYYEMTGSIQERMFVDIGESGQVVGADIVLSGKLGTPLLDQDGAFEMIKPAFPTPQGDNVPVIHLAWQVEGKLNAWISRKKNSDFQDLTFLFRTYSDDIKEWSENLTKEWRLDFYQVYKATYKSAADRKALKETLLPDMDSGSGGSGGSGGSLPNQDNSNPLPDLSAEMSSLHLAPQKEEVWVETTLSNDIVSFEWGTKVKNGKDKAKVNKSRAASWKKSTTVYEGESLSCFKFDSNEYGVIFCTWEL